MTFPYHIVMRKSNVNKLQ